MNVGVGVGVAGAVMGVDLVVVDFAAVGVVDVVGTGAIDRATRVTGAVVVVVGVGTGVAVSVAVAVSVGVGVGHPGGMVTVGVGVGVTVGVTVGVEVGVGDQVGQTTEVESVGNGSVALGEFSLGSGRALVGDPVGVVVGSGLGFADELGRLVGSGTGLIG